MKTTADCKKFIVDFFTNNPNVLSHFSNNDKTFAQKFLKEKNWKRAFKSKPNGLGQWDDSHPAMVDNNGNIMVFPNGCTVNRYGEAVGPGKFVHYTTFVVQRGFELDGEEGEYAFLVYEDANGNLVMGESYGG